MNSDYFHTHYTKWVNLSKQNTKVLETGFDNYLIIQNALTISPA